MEDLIKMLGDIERGHIPAATSFCQDFVDVMMWNGNHAVDKEAVRSFLYATHGRDVSEDFIEKFMRDLYTKHLVLANPKDTEKLNKLISRYFINLDGTVQVEAVRKLREQAGYKYYPVVYGKKGPTIGIMTQMGNITIAPTC